MLKLYNDKKFNLKMFSFFKIVAEPTFFYPNSPPFTAYIIFMNGIT